jgi:hypothetical protein
MLAAVPVGAQRRIVTGVVQDVNNQPQVGVNVALTGAKSVATDDSGRFRIEVPHRNRVTLDLRRVGLMPSRLGPNEGGDTVVTVTVLLSPETLERVNVTAKQPTGIAEFDQRLLERTRGTGSGFFVTAAEIEQRRPSKLSHMLGEFPSIECKRPNKDGRCFLVGNRMVVKPGGRGYDPCVITVYLDAIRLNPMTSSTIKDGFVEGQFVDLDAVITPESVAGVEYYPSGNRTPPKFQALTGACGVLLIWSRRGK